MLEQRSFAEISVDDLAKGAGLSRPTFYFYFPSKDAVLVTLVDRVIAEADRNADEAMRRHGRRRSIPPACGTTASTPSSSTFGPHRAVAARRLPTRARRTPSCACCGRVHAEVDRLHRRRRSPSRTGPRCRARHHPGSDLATALNLMNERTMLAAFADERPAIAPEQLVDTLAHVWVTSIYGKTLIRRTSMRTYVRVPAVGSDHPAR